MKRESFASVNLGYQWYVVGICTVAYIFSFIDRQILSLLIEPIKADLVLTDTQFSLLSGLAFSLIYSCLGIPIAILADRRSRPLIISIGIAFWSLATAFSGLSKSFLHLFLARVGVGAGEAALSPAAYSMFSDMFPKDRLGRAYGFYALGSFLGGAAAFAIGGYMIDQLAAVDTVVLPIVGALRPWQLTFIVVGLPGLVIALVMYLTVRDPGRTGLRRDGSGNIQRVALRDVFAFLWQHRATFSSHFLGFSCYAMVLLGLMAWTPAYFMRNFGLSAGETGSLLGAVVLIANGSGVLLAGGLVDRLTRRGHVDSAMRAGVIGAVGMVVPVVLFTQVSNLALSVVLLAIAMFFASFPMPTSTAAMQQLAPNQMRAQVSALFLLVSNLIGLALGTFLVALVTDQIFGDPRRVGSSMSLVYGVAGVLTILLLARGCAAFRSSMATETRDEPASLIPVTPATPATKESTR